MIPREDEQLLDIAQAAYRANVGHETIRRWIRAGKLKAVKTIGGHWRISRSSLVASLHTTDVNKHTQ